MTLLSDTTEWHAFTWGVYRGVTTRPRKTPPIPDNSDVGDEPHYYRGGYIVGSVLQVIFLFVVSYGVFRGV